MPPTCGLQALCNPEVIYFILHFSIKKPRFFFPWRGGKLRHSKASSLALGWGREQEYLLIWDGLICTGHFLICTRSIRRLSLPLVNELFRNYSDALCHQILITRSAFLAGLHGAFQAGSQAPESQASSEYMHCLFLIMVGRHQLGSHLTSTSYRRLGVSVSISTFPLVLARVQGGSPGPNLFSNPWTHPWEEPHVGGLRGRFCSGCQLLGAPGISAARLPADTVAWANFTPILFPLCEIPGRPSTLADIQNCHLFADINLEASVIPHIKMLSRGASTAKGLAVATPRGQPIHA